MGVKHRRFAVNVLMDGKRREESFNMRLVFLKEGSKATEENCKHSQMIFM